MNLTELKAAAETAKTGNTELELWQMEISPDDVLRLVEVARLASIAITARRKADRAATVFTTSPREARIAAMTAEVNANTAAHNLRMALKGIEL